MSMSMVGFRRRDRLQAIEPFEGRGADCQAPSGAIIEAGPGDHDLYGIFMRAPKFPVEPLLAGSWDVVGHGSTRHPGMGLVACVTAPSIKRVINDETLLQHLMVVCMECR